LLATVPIGRVSFLAGGGIVVLPVNYLMDGPDPVFRTARGSKLSSAEGYNLVAFEADHYDERTRLIVARPRRGIRASMASSTSPGPVVDDQRARQGRVRKP
jgi:hypothetical protein